MRHDKSELEADDFDDIVLGLLTDDIADWRYRLLLAKARGSDDRTAWQFAGLTEEQFHNLVEQDYTLERDLLAVRAGAFLRHIRKIGSVPQWQAHEFLLDKLWPGISADCPQKSSEETEMENSVGRVTRNLSLPQLRQPALLIELGAQRQEERESQNSNKEDQSCPNCKIDSSAASSARLEPNESCDAKHD